MWVRGLRARGAEDDGDLARPESPSRCTLPITALRVMPPSSPAIWLADRPSAQRFLSDSPRSSVQDMSLYPLIGNASAAGRIRPRSPATGRTGLTHAAEHRELFATTCRTERR